MYDACNYTRPPRDAEMVAGYLNGGCRWPAQAFTYWEAARIVRIATNATMNAGAVLDVERGDATPNDAPGWCARARQRGQVPTVYTSQANVPAVLAACKLHGVAPPLIWMAWWNGVASVPPGCIAKQYANVDAKGYDLSAVADYWPGVDPAPQPISEVSRVYPYIITNAHSGDFLVNADRTLVPLGSSADVLAYQAAGFKVIPVSDAMFQNLKNVAPTPAPPA